MNDIAGILGAPLASAPARLSIAAIVKAFGSAARLAKDAGFAGVERHGAHGYLISQFLSPLSNLRADRYGGSLENRMRFLVEVLRSVRSAVGDEVPVALELSSADFLRGGFTIEESVIVARTIDEEGIDFIEVSGGTYERPAMVAVEKMSTAEREGHFLEYARAIRGVVRAPLMLTGGLRTPAVMASIVAEGAVDLIGVARPIALEPDLPRQKISGRTDASLAARVEGTSPFAAAKDLSWYAAQLHRMGSGKEPEADLSRWTAFASAAIGAFLRSRRRARS